MSARDTWSRRLREREQPRRPFWQCGCRVHSRPRAYPVLRFAVAWTVGVWGVGDEVLRRRFWLVPLRDAIHFVIWLASLGSNRIRWGNLEYVIRQGRMAPVGGVERPVAKPAEDVPRS